MNLKTNCIGTSVLDIYYYLFMINELIYYNTIVSIIKWINNLHIILYNL